MYRISAISRKEAFSALSATAAADGSAGSALRAQFTGMMSGTL
jgi:hypothetical protein